MMAFHTVLGDEIPVPFETVFPGMLVEVIARGWLSCLNRRGQLLLHALCRCPAR